MINFRDEMRVILSKKCGPIDDIGKLDEFEALDELNEKCTYEKEQIILKSFAKFTNTENKLKDFKNKNK